MKIYQVGGSLRDELLGLTPKDYDYVVTGSTPEQMIELGYTQVGADFPVFLHPETKDEYALARTERKLGAGYKGFTCQWEGVTLEEDLSRRDLTINSMAKDLETGLVIDPFGGQQDLKDKVLRHTTDAFAEDPLRVLRVARFQAKFGEEWCIACETWEMMHKVYGNGDLANLTPERVWLETDKALNTENPSFYFSVISSYRKLWCNTQDMVVTGQRLDHHPEDDVWTHTALVMDYAAKTYNDSEINFACYTHDFGKPVCWQKYQNAHGHEKEGLPFIVAFCDKFKVPNRYHILALLVCEYHTKVHGIMGRNEQNWTRPKSIMKLFEDTGALRNQERFLKLLKCCESDAKGRGVDRNGHTPYETTKEYYLNKPYPQAEYLAECLEAVINLDTKTITATMVEQGKLGTDIGEAIRVERISKIRGVQNKWKNKSKS